MPNVHQIMGIAAGIVSLIAFIPYITSTIRGNTKPNRATWWIWTVVGVLLASSYRYSGATNTIWVSISYILGPFVAALVSIKYGEGGWTRLDRCCILGALVSLGLWWFFDSALIGLIAGLFIDFFGSIPTIRKSYLEPGKENRLAWMLAFSANAINLFAIDKVDFVLMIYPLYMFIAVGVITVLVVCPRKHKGRKIK